MWELCFDEYTGTYFVGNSVTIKANLLSLKNNIIKSRRSFLKINEYCRALGIPEEDPFDTAIIFLGIYDIPFLFDDYYSMCLGTPAHAFSIAG